jgi:transposase
MQLPAKSTACDIRIELRRGATSITVTWPTDAAAECAAWMRELLR